jgi:hypothetical protein
MDPKWKEKIRIAKTEELRQLQIMKEKVNKENVRKEEQLKSEKLLNDMILKTKENLCKTYMEGMEKTTNLARQIEDTKKRTQDLPDVDPDVLRKSYGGYGGGNIGISEEAYQSALRKSIGREDFASP